MTNKIGFDLENSYFYIHGSNVRDVMSVGSSLATSVVSLYAANNSNIGFHVGVDAYPPRLWCGEIGNTAPTLYISDGKVGIGINFSDSVLYNIASLDVNSGMTVRGNPQRHIMNGTQFIRALKTTGMRSSPGEQVEYMTVSWNLSPDCFDPTFKIDVNFYGSGTANITRMHMKCECLVDVLTGTLDVVLDKSTFQSDNVTYIDLYVQNVSSTSLQIGAKWRLVDTVNHKGHMKIEVTAPSELINLIVSP